jgi:O-antigen/teichoic acid export membrane protein
MNVKKTLNIVYIVFLIRFFFQTVNPVFEAKQKLYLVKFVLFISQMMIYIVLLTLANKVDFDLFRLALVFSIIPVLILVATAIFFFISNPLLRPSLFLIRIKLLPELYSLSIRFFLIQLNMLVLFQSTNFLILRNLGSSEVVKYNIVINLFSMMNIAFSSISAPYWAAYTSAWTIGDTKWIKKTQLKLLKIWLLIVLISSIVLLNSSRIYILWVGNSISIPFELSVAVFVYMCFFTFGMIFNIFLNSTGKIYLQTLSLTILTLCYIPLVVLLIKVFKLGLISIPISLCIVSLYTVLVAPFQSNRLLNGVAKGLFNK